MFEGAPPATVSASPLCVQARATAREERPPWLVRLPASRLVRVRATTTMPAARSLATPSCVPLDGRTNGAPGWCSEFTQASCADYYEVNIHMMQRPCIWLQEVGCRAANATGCSSPIEEPLILEQAPPAAVVDSDSSTPILPLLFLLLAAALTFRWWHLRRMQLPDPLADWARHTLERLRSPPKLSRAGPEEELERLQDDEEANLAMGGGLTPAPLNATLSTEVEVACAAAHAVLHADCHSQPSTASVAQALDAAAETEAAGASTENKGGAEGAEGAEGKGDGDGDVGDGSGVVGGDIEDLRFGGGKHKKRGNDDIELPSYSVRESMAAFEEGDLLAKVVQEKQATGAAGAGDGDGSDSDDEGGSARRYLASKQNLAMSLD